MFNNKSTPFIIFVTTKFEMDLIDSLIIVLFYMIQNPVETPTTSSVVF